MNEKTSSSNGTRSRCAGVLSLLFNVLIKSFCLIVLAWIFLTIWFGIPVIKNYVSVPIELWNDDAVISVIATTINMVKEKLVSFILHLPLLGLFLFVMVVDGLGQRTIRKYQCARESAFLFHQMKSFVGKFFYLSFLIYLSIPVTDGNTTLLLTMDIVLSVMVMLMIKNYKKYL